MNQEKGQVMVEYVFLVLFLILGLSLTFIGLKEGLFNYYKFLTVVICLPIP